MSDTVQRVVNTYSCGLCGAIQEAPLKQEMAHIKCKCGGKKWILLAEGNYCDEEIEKAKLKIAACYEDMIEMYKKYTDLRPEYYRFISLWVLGTYFHDSLDTYPILFLNAMRGSGKTRTEKLSSALGHGGTGAVHNNITEAVLFRHPKHHILCLDEIEQVSNKEKQTLRELLNAAYKKGVIVQRMKKVRVAGEEKQVTETFEPYFPIMLANIKGIDEVLADRSITLIIEKSNNPAITWKVEDFDTNPTILNIKRTLTEFSDVCDITLRKKNYITAWNDYVDMRYNITNIYNNITSLTPLTPQDLDLEEMFNKIAEAEIYGRNFELLFPLLLVARMINYDTFLDILSIGKQIMIDKSAEEYTESKEVSLYQFIAEHGKKEYWGIKDMCNHFRLYVGDIGDEDPWLNEKWLGRALKRLNLIKEKRKMASGSFVIADIEKAKEKIEMFKPRCRE